MKIIDKIKSILSSIGVSGVLRICIWAIITLLCGWLPPFALISGMMIASLVSEIILAHTEGDYYVTVGQVLSDWAGIVVGLFAIFLNSL